MRLIPDPGPAPPPLPNFLRRHRIALRHTEIMQHWTRWELRSALKDGRIARPFAGVYCASDTAEDPLVRASAVTAWEPRGLVSGELALHLYNAGYPAPDAATCVVTRGLRPDAMPSVRIVQSGPVPRAGAPKGIPCTVPERALLDAWRFATPNRRQEVFYQALWSRACTWRALRREVENTSRIPDRRQLTSLLNEFTAGATSPLEVRAHREVFTGPLFAGFERQVELRIGDRRPIVDMLHRESRVVVEFDGARYHGGSNAVAADNERGVVLATADFVTLRLSWGDVVGRPEWCRRAVLDTVAARARRPREVLQ